MLDQIGALTAASPDFPAFGRADEGDAALLDCIGPVQGSRVLLIGHGAIGLMCALIRRGCADAAVLRPDERPARASADVVVVCHAPTAGCIDEEIANACRALAPLDSLVLRLPLDSSAPLVRHAIRLLRLHGFRCLGGERLPDRIVLTAELPAFGKPACAA